MSNSGIYSIKNTINGKIYIGSSKEVNERLSTHKRELLLNKHVNEHLQSAYNKYGEDAFKFEVVCECDELNLLEMEDYYIKEFDTLNRDKGYNLVSADRKTILKSTKDKISNTLKEGYLSGRIKISDKCVSIMKSRTGINNHNFNKPMSEEQKRLISLSRMGKKASEETRAKMSMDRKGKGVGIKHSPERIEANRLSHLGKKLSEETKKKMSDSHKLRRSKQYERQDIN